LCSDLLSFPLRVFIKSGIIRRVFHLESITGGGCGIGGGGGSVVFRVNCFASNLSLLALWLPTANFIHADDVTEADSTNTAAAAAASDEDENDDDDDDVDDDDQRPFRFIVPTKDRLPERNKN